MAAVGAAWRGVVEDGRWMRRDPELQDSAITIETHLQVSALASADRRNDGSADTRTIFGEHQLHLHNDTSSSSVEHH